MNQNSYYQVNNNCSIHNNKITYICLKQSCGQPRGSCQDCIELYHNNHKNDIIRWTDLEDKAIQLINIFNSFQNVLEDTCNSVLEMKTFCQNLKIEDFFFRDVQTNVNKFIDLQNFCLNLQDYEKLMKKIQKEGSEYFISQLSYSQSFSNAIKLSRFVNEYENLQINFENLQQNNMVQVDKQNNILSCSQFHGFFHLEYNLRQKQKQEKVSILLLEIGSIKLGFGDVQKFYSSNQWPELQKDVNHGCYLIDEYGYMYQHGKEQKVYSTPSIQMCKNDKIVMKILNQEKKIIWQNSSKQERIETVFDDSLYLYPLFFLSGSTIQILND